MARILAINPGSTSTKIAVYDDKKELFSETITHPVEELSKYNRVVDQFEMRKGLIINMLEDKGITLDSLAAVVARGGVLPPVKAGAYAVNQAMLDYLQHPDTQEHASNLGAGIAQSIASPLGKPAYIYDSIAVNEMMPVATLSGIKGISRFYIGHKLNVRAMAIKYAEKIGKSFSDLNAVVAHLGGGISTSLIVKGRIVDIISDDQGSFSPERAGNLPFYGMLDKIFAENMTKRDVMKLIKTQGGLVSHLGTADCREVETRIVQGDEYAALVYEAMAYNISKTIGALAAAGKGNLDAVIITGGIARSKMLVDMVVSHVQFIGHVEVMPGENEMEALAYGALRVLNGEESAHTFEG